MRTWLMAGLTLGLVVLALAQTGQGQKKAQGPLRFDPKTVVTVQGIVVDAPVLKPGGSRKWCT